MSQLKKYYDKKVRSQLKERFLHKNPMLIPKLEKIVLNMGIAEAAKDKNLIPVHLEELMLIAAQRPVVTRARISVSNFKLRQGQAIGLKVVLRGKKMFDFMERFCCIAAPRIRDFRGFRPKGDGRGNYSCGIDDQQIFCELNLDKVKRQQGMDITFVTSAQNDDECVELLRLLGMPFKDKPVVVPGLTEGFGEEN